MRWLSAFDSSLVEIDGHTFYAPALTGNSVVADLGAAGARFSVTLAERYGCRCYAAEPHPDVYRLIPRHERLTAFPVAISGRTGTVAMALRDAHHASATSLPLDAGNGRIEVDSLTLEGFLDRAGLADVDLIKLDIEGAEFAMFEAARDDTLRRVGQLSVEFHDFLDPALTPSCVAVIRRLEGLGFAAIRFPSRHHGDVLFLNRRRLGLSATRIAWYRHVVRPLRGLGRMLARRARAAGG